MYFQEEDVYADLYSGDPEKIGLALEHLTENAMEFYYLNLEKFGLEVLEPFGEEVPEKVQFDFFTVIDSYTFKNDFEYSMEEKEKIFFQLLLKYGYSYIAFNLVQLMRISGQYEESLNRVIELISHVDDFNEKSITGLQYLLINFTYGSKEIADMSIVALSKLPCNEGMREVIDYIRPSLTDEEWPLFDHIPGIVNKTLDDIQRYRYVPGVAEKPSSAASLYKDYAFYFKKFEAFSSEIVYDYSFMVSRGKAKQRLPAIPADHTFIHDFIAKIKKAVFQNNGIDIGCASRSGKGFTCCFTQGGMKKEVFFPELKMDMFVANYLFKLYAHSENETQDPAMDNQIYKDIRKTPFNPKEFTGYVTFMKKDFDREMLNRIAADFALNNDNARISFFNGNEKEIFLCFDPQNLCTNNYGLVVNQKYVIECKSDMSYYDCIKLDAYLNYAFNKTHNCERYAAFEQYYLCRENLFIPQDLE